MTGAVTGRRDFLMQTGGLAAAAMFGPVAAAAQEAVRRPRVAAIFTELRFRSHAFNILENFLGPYLFCGRKTDPGVDVVSFYADQFPDKDLAREVSQRFRVPLFDSIKGALCRGGDALDVDAVLLIGEHGDYPSNELGQHMYPRKEFFDQIAAVVGKSGRSVPVFNDKHLSYRWDWAKEMYDTARRLNMPLLAGSSVPLAQRRPAVEIPPGSRVESALVVHSGGLESYGFHGLEVLQSMIEDRCGGGTCSARRCSPNWGRTGIRFRA